ncbi:MAG: pilus assembly protein PilZ [Spirochaetaceae bacterium]|jgi:hypothetical protein|nr:pilus assembly protein PilZ [Spirochaetaceae bacterium]
MGVVTSQKITTYYERYKSIDVTFTKEIIQVTGMITQQVFLKCLGDFWPCVVYSSSFQGAKIVANTRSGVINKLKDANNSASLRLSFKNPETGAPVTFFVSARSLGYSPYGGSKDMAIFTLQFTQRPPDDLIEIMGRLLDANVNSAKRRDERILITVESMRKMRLLAKESAVFIQGVPRRCILRDISFSGAKLIMMGVAKFLVGRESALRMDFDDPRESFLVKGKFIRAESVESRKDLVALALVFDESLVPMGYKVRVNDYLSQIRTDNRYGDGQAGGAKAAHGKAEAPKPELEPPPIDDPGEETEHKAPAESGDEGDEAAPAAAGTEP